MVAARAAHRDRFHGWHRRRRWSAGRDPSDPGRLRPRARAPGAAKVARVPGEPGRRYARRPRRPRAARAAGLLRESDPPRRARSALRHLARRAGAPGRPRPAAVPRSSPSSRTSGAIVRGRVVVVRDGQPHDASYGDIVLEIPPLRGPLGHGGVFELEPVPPGPHSGIVRARWPALQAVVRRPGRDARGRRRHRVVQRGSTHDPPSAPVDRRRARGDAGAPQGRSVHPRRHQPGLVRYVRRVRRQRCRGARRRPLSLPHQPLDPDRYQRGQQRQLRDAQDDAHRGWAPTR